MPLQQTSGNVTADAYGGGGGVAIIPNYIEDVFSTWLYTGTGAAQTITNGIDLSGQGGLVWIKSRSAATSHFLFDTARGALNEINSNTTEAQASLATSLTAFNTTGFTLGAAAGINVNAATYASWTFREQPKFFDVVTYTGDAISPKTISHSLDSVPGCIIIKRTDTTGDWWNYHNSITVNQYLKLNTTAAVATSTAIWGTGPTTTGFTVNAGALNAAGGTYVAYIFAHNAGGFGTTNTDNVISCGSYTGNGLIAGPVVSLGYEPQWLMIKNATGTGNWQVIDNMRKMAVTTNEELQANLIGVETAVQYVTPLATGFQVVSTSAEVNTSASKYIYIAIRRGPMKVPTDGTNVFAPVARTGTGVNATVTGLSFSPDLDITQVRTGLLNGSGIIDRLRGTTQMLSSAFTATESDFGSPNAQSITSLDMNGLSFGDDVQFARFNQSGSGYVNWMFKRAPSFFDEVCYTGTGVVTTQAHNLAAVPELMLVKSRSNTLAWQVYSSALANTEYLVLDTTAAKATGTTRWNSTTPTSAIFSLGTAAEINTSAATYVAYLFATCPGVSKVGSYTGNGATQAIACGFAGGARFVLLKRTDDVGNWYVYDTARGMTTLTDPVLLLNSTAAEAATAGSVTTTTGGFTVNGAIFTAINAVGGSYIFLAIA